MRTHRVETIFTVLAAVALVLAAGSCNRHDDPETAEGVPVVSAITYNGVSVSDPTTDVVANLTVKIEDRNGNANTFFNEVTFTDYTVEYFGVVPNPPPGVISTGFIPVGSTGSLFLTVLPAADKAGFMAGQALLGRLQVNGHDLLGNPVSFTADLAIIFAA